MIIRIYLALLPTETSTINTGSILTGTSNISVKNGSINLKKSIETNNASFNNLSVNTLIIPKNGLNMNKINNLTSNISRINSSITNLCTDVPNLNTSVDALGNIQAVAITRGGYAQTWGIASRNWAESSEPPGGGSTKSEKSWSTTAQNWSNSANG